MKKILNKKMLISILIFLLLGLNIIPIINGSITMNIHNKNIKQSNKKYLSIKNKIESRNENMYRFNVLAPWDFFGISVSISGENAIVGAMGDNLGTGSAYIFNKNGNQWFKVAKIRNTFFSPDAWFGLSVSIDNNYAIVSAPMVRNDTGEAYVFERDGISWIKKAILSPSDAKPGYTIGFMSGVSISGDYAIVGAPGGINESGIDTGLAYVFKRNEDTWKQVQKLTPSKGEPGGGFGFSISVNGDYAIISSLGSINTSGLAFIFKRNNNNWEEMQILNVSDGEGEDIFGICVSMDDDYAVVGAEGENNETGAAYVFKRSDMNWTLDAILTAYDGEDRDGFAWSLSNSGDYIIIGAFNDDFGSAYIFKRSISSWDFDEKIIAYDQEKPSWFGYSVSIDGDYACIGAPEDSTTGAAYIYKRYDTGWTLDKRITAQKGRSRDVIKQNIFSRFDNIFPILQKILNYIL